VGRGGNFWPNFRDGTTLKSGSCGASTSAELPANVPTNQRSATIDGQHRQKRAGEFIVVHLQKTWHGRIDL
jgi:hypothetical protein